MWYQASNSLRVRHSSRRCCFCVVCYRSTLMTKTWQAKRAANQFGIGVIYHSHKRRTLPAQPCSRIGSRKFTARIDLIRLFLSGASEGSHRFLFSGPTIPNSGLFSMSLGFDWREMFALIVDACGVLFIVRHSSQNGHLVTVWLVRTVTGTSAGSSTVCPLHQERRVASCCARSSATSTSRGPFSIGLGVFRSYIKGTSP